MVVKACPLCQQVLAVACKSCPSCGHIFQAKKSSSSKQSEKKPVTLTDSRLRSERNRKAATQQVANAKSSTKEDNTGLSGEISSNRAPKSAKSVTIDGEGNIKIKTNDNEACNKEAAGSQSGETLPIKKRGRPKGSKDKQKRLPKGYKQLKLVRNHDINAHAEWEIKESSDPPSSNTTTNDRDSRLSRKRGRPRGTRTKSSMSPLFYAEDDDDEEEDDDDDDFFEDTDKEGDGHVNNQEQTAYYIPAEKQARFSLILEGINQTISSQSFST